MGGINNLLLIATAIVAILNLLLEIEDIKTIKHEVTLKICFGGIAVLSLMAVGQSLSVFIYVFNFYVLITLSFRLRIRLNALS